MTLLLKDPDAVLDYSVDWGSEYLTGDLIADSGWTVEPDEPGGVTIVGNDFDATTALVKAAGGHGREALPAGQQHRPAVGAGGQARDRAARGETMMELWGLSAPAGNMSEAQAYVRIETGEEEAVLAGLKSVGAESEGQALSAMPRYRITIRSRGG